MRKEKFNKQESSDDIVYAFQYNSLGNRLDDIECIVAQVCGENDGFSWYWILKMKNKTFSWATGSCDYTGWDCLSDASISDGFNTANKAIENIDTTEYEGRRFIKQCLQQQIDGTLAYAVYTEPNP